ncbi:MAG: GatB/YqeY domain-containing protein [Spirochaetaceae bacterium]|nr:GatB/YqeY domain-containing protein [Spirochaetaceae bacterium]MBP5329901.1 GatB/YqeY domain-containing protein [Spirochaetaceae bacterium]
MTTKEMFKERMQIRKTDPVKASVLGILIDTVQKNIRESGREETETDIKQAAKKLYDQTLATIAEYKKGNADTTQLEQELAILEAYVPAALSPEQTEAEVKKVIDSLPAEERNLKNIMPKLKEIEGIDMKSVRAIVDKILSKAN